VTTGELRTKIDAVWNAFWTGGISNPLEVIEQITYLPFLRGLDDAQLLEERRAARLGRPMTRILFPPVNDAKVRAYADLRWSRFKDREPLEMFIIIPDHASPSCATWRRRAPAKPSP
jgi:type I restriction enzyme M protein